jgi:DNA-binding MarR family transcriptional regulator
VNVTVRAGSGRQTTFRDATLTPMRSPNDIPSGPATRLGSVDESGYTQLAALRSGIRRYLAWAEERAREHGMTPAQVQLALAVRSHADPAGPTLTELADTLLLRHHSVVGLVDRAELAGLVRRARDPEHRSRVHVRLTQEGAQRLQTLSALHLEWLAESGPQLAQVWASFGAPSR